MFCHQLFALFFEIYYLFNYLFYIMSLYRYAGILVIVILEGFIFYFGFMHIIYMVLKVCH